VLGRGKLDGIPVYWIRVHGEWDTDVADDRLHEWAHDVAVSQATYEPVGVRETLDGKDSPDGPSRILTFETLRDGEGVFTAQSNDWEGRAIVIGPGRTLSRGEAANVMGEPSLWIGAAFSGLRLVHVSSIRQRVSRGQGGSSGWVNATGVYLFYGADDDPCATAASAFGYCRGEGTFVAIRQEPRLLLGGRRWVPPDGSVLLEHGQTAFLRRKGVYVRIEASSEGLVLAAARALEPMPG
jgi:hypothetical protein